MGQGWPVVHRDRTIPSARHWHKFALIFAMATERPKIACHQFWTFTRSVDEILLPHQSGMAIRYNRAPACWEDTSLARHRPHDKDEGDVLSISAVLPAYNEEEVISHSVAAMVKTFEALGADYEVIVVNDGSRDRTGEILTRLGQENPRVRMVAHKTNQGYGAALWTGFTSARKDLVFLTDGDKQFDVDELRLLLPMLDGADMAIGYRKHRADPPLRLLNAWGWKQLVNGLFGYTARDIDCAFKLFRRSILDRVDVHARGATFSAEFLIKSRRLGYVIRERAVSHYPRPAGVATGAKPAVIIRAFRELIHLRLNLDADLARAPQGHKASHSGT
jgi:glycosyltransferase involved in cell wall biosynthesis